MTIADAREKCKGLLARIPRDVLVIAVLLFASSSSFALGYMAGREEKQGDNFRPEDSPIADISESISAAASSGKFVASKNGTKYYLPDCAGVDRISEANKVWFATAAAAVSAGYAPAANCKGL